MNQSTTPQAKPKATNKVSRQSRIYKTIIQAIEERKGEHIIAIDLRKISEAVTDFFIICQASNSTQIKAIADWIGDLVREELDEMPFHTEGYQSAKWIVVDYVNIVVHIMHPEVRSYYRLEDMWSDGGIEEIDNNLSN